MLLKTGKKVNTERAYSLTEILIAVAIILLFLLAAILAIRSMLTNNRDNLRRTDLSNIQQALEDYKAEFGRYPETLADLVDTNFLDELPLDPLKDSLIPGSDDIYYGYYYRSLKDGRDYDLYTYLEGNTGRSFGDGNVSNVNMRDPEVSLSPGDEGDGTGQVRVNGRVRDGTLNGTFTTVIDGEEIIGDLTDVPVDDPVEGPVETVCEYENGLISTTSGPNEFTGFIPSCDLNPDPPGNGGGTIGGGGSGGGGGSNPTDPGIVDPRIDLPDQPPGSIPDGTLYVWGIITGTMFNGNFEGIVGIPPDTENVQGTMTDFEVRNVDGSGAAYGYCQFINAEITGGQFTAEFTECDLTLYGSVDPGNPIGPPIIIVEPRPNPTYVIFPTQYIASITAIEQEELTGIPTNTIAPDLLSLTPSPGTIVPTRPPFQSPTPVLSECFCLNYEPVWTTQDGGSCTW